MTIREEYSHRGNDKLCFFFFYNSAAAQHLRMQNEQASETVAMVIVTRLIVTRILIKAHTATHLPGRPSR